MGVRPAALLALSVHVSGCSFMTMRTDPMAQLAVLPEVEPACVTTYFAPAVDSVASVVEVALAYIWTRQTLDTTNEAPGGAPGAALLALLIQGVVGVVTGGSAVHGFTSVRACRASHTAFAELAIARRARDDRASRRERAWELAKAAELAARRGECELVRQRDLEIAALDLDLRDTVFVRDVAVARCLK